MTRSSGEIDAEHLLRELAPQVLGAVIRRFHDFAAAEDAVQEALVAAAMQWPREGVPDNPRGWLIQVASRRMTDHLRSEGGPAAPGSRRRPRAGNARPPELEPDRTGRHAILFFMCCHPSLTPSSAIALTLRAVGGLTTAEIASAFLVPEATMAQRISRAKHSIKASGVPFRLPTSAGARPTAARCAARALSDLQRRLHHQRRPAICSGSNSRSEAIRLTRSVHALLPDDAEVAGLLALMLLTDARRTARTGPDGELIPLTQAGSNPVGSGRRSPRASRCSRRLCRKGSIGAYQLQAAIAAVHDEAARAEDTDWPQILALYELLKRMSDNPMVMLNHAIAAAMVHGPPKDSICSARSTPTGGLQAIIGWTPFAPICWKWPATMRPQRNIIGLPPAGPRTYRNGTIFLDKRRDSPTARGRQT